MSRILIVEDQFLIAIAIEDAVNALGHHVIGIAASRSDVDRLDEFPDIALVDVNLLDGPTGPEIGRELAACGCRVIFMTANPEAVKGGIDGTVGVISKPVMDLDLVSLLQYTVSLGGEATFKPPRGLTVFSPTHSAM